MENIRQRQPRRVDPDVRFGGGTPPPAAKVPPDKAARAFPATRVDFDEAFLPEWELELTAYEAYMMAEQFVREVSQRVQAEMKNSAGRMRLGEFEL